MPTWDATVPFCDRKALAAATLSFACLQFLSASSATGATTTAQDDRWLVFLSEELLEITIVGLLALAALAWRVQFSLEHQLNEWGIDRKHGAFSKLGFLLLYAFTVGMFLAAFAWLLATVQTFFSGDWQHSYVPPGTVRYSVMDRFGRNLCGLFSLPQSGVREWLGVQFSCILSYPKALEPNALSVLALGPLVLAGAILRMAYVLFLKKES